MISDITIHPSVAASLGLKEAKCKNLGRLVVLAGPNGAGKSRYLSAIQQTADLAYNARVQAGAVRDQLARSLAFREHTRVRLAQSTEQLERSRENNADSPLSGHLTQEVRNHETTLVQLEQQCDNAASTLSALQADFEHVTFFEPDSTVQAQPVFVSLSYPGASFAIADPQQLSLGRARIESAKLTSGGFATAHSGMHVYLAEIARTLWNAGHPKFPPAAAQLEEAHSFNAITMALLGASVEPFVDSDGHPQPLLRSRPFATHELSQGEKVLISWAITLHKQGASLRNATVLLDEPETHLHPDACILALGRLGELLGPHGQIWVATHSVPLIAYIGADSLYLVVENSISFASHRMDAVMNALLGGTEGRHRLQAMLSDAEDITGSRFLAECLVMPKAVDTGADDPQKLMLAQIIDAHKTTGAPLRLLDYGAGKGRLAGALSESASRQPAVEYFAFNDPVTTSQDDKHSCLAKIAALGQAVATETYYWENLANLRAHTGPSFDIVVLSNVLHEVEPADWFRLFGDISSVLSEKGCVLVLEDLVPAVGELPHEIGYIMLDEYALKILFCDSDRVKRVASARDGRLSAVALPKSCLHKISTSSRADTLRHVRHHARDQIEAARRQSGADRQARHGREHAHYTVQFANASLALERLGDPAVRTA